MRFTANGCQPCRAAHKKCNGVRPVCERCLRTGKHCHGYSEAFSIIHTENIYASGRRQRPRGVRQLATRDIAAEALTYYMHFHLPPSSAADQGFREAVTCACTTNRPALASAVSAASLAIFSRLRGESEIERRAVRSYHESIRALRLALPDVDSGSVDTYLLTILFLARYEDSIHARKNQVLGKLVHIQGLAAGLKYWSQNLGKDDRKTNDVLCTSVIKQSRRVVRKAALLGQYPLPAWLHDGAKFGEYDMDLQLDRILLRLIRLRSRISRLVDEHNTSPTHEAQDLVPTLQGLYQDCESIDQALRAWIDRLPDSAVFAKRDIADMPSWPDGSSYHPFIYTNRTPLDAAARVQTYGYRILVNHLRCSLLDFIESKTTAFLSRGRRFECHHVMTRLAYDLAASVPFCVHKVAVPHDGGTISYDQEAVPYLVDLVAMPLVVASISRYMQVEYRRWFRTQLGKVGRATGYGILEDAAENPRFQL